MQLVTVQGSMALEATTASAWASMDAASRHEYGVDLVISSPGGAWRSPEMVLDMYRNPAKYGATKGVAKPRSLGGPGSVHENGRCVDINNWATLGSTRLDNLARRFGFRRTIAKEPWHYEHDGATGGGFAGGIDEEDELDTTQAYQLDQVFKALLGVDAAGRPVALDPNVNFGQSIRTSIFEARKGIQKLIDSPYDVNALADAIVDRLPSGTLTKQDVEAAAETALRRVFSDAAQV